MATYDILIFQGVATDGEQQVGLSLGRAGSFATGIQKLAQTFAKLFLTDVGSVNGDASFGTSFMSALRANRIRDETSLDGAFRTAVLEIFNYMVEREDILPDDETLAAAELVSYDLRPGFLSITVKITSVAGESRVYQLPVDTRATE